MKCIALILTLIALAGGTIALASGFKCPSCRSLMIWTGDTKVEWGRLFYLHECPAGHKYWFKSSSASSEGSGRGSDSTTSKSLKCPVCGMNVIWTGDTRVEWGKLFKIYECPAGHKSVGK